MIVIKIRRKNKLRSIARAWRRNQKEIDARR
jgi:hypothetical protein